MSRADEQAREPRGLYAEGPLEGGHGAGESRNPTLDTPRRRGANAAKPSQVG